MTAPMPPSTTGSPPGPATSGRRSTSAPAARTRPGTAGRSPRRAGGQADAGLGAGPRRRPRAGLRRGHWGGSRPIRSRLSRRAARRTWPRCAQAAEAPGAGMTALDQGPRPRRKPRPGKIGLTPTGGCSRASGSIAGIPAICPPTRASAPASSHGRGGCAGLRRAARPHRRAPRPRGRRADARRPRTPRRARGARGAARMTEDENRGSTSSGSGGPPHSSPAACAGGGCGSS